MLNPALPDQAAVAKEMASLALDAGVYEEDLLSYRAERLLMHARVLGTISAERRASLEARRKQEPGTRVFSVGIGGVDLGMNAVLARAKFKSGRLGLSSGERTAAAAPAQAPTHSDARASEPAHAPVADPSLLPQGEWPDHGLGPADQRTTTVLPDGAGSIVSRRLPGSLVRTGSFKQEGTGPVRWDEYVSSIEGPEVRERRRIADPAGKLPAFERVEEGRFLSYRLDRSGSTLRATAAPAASNRQAFGDSVQASAPAAVPAASPAALMAMDVLPPDVAPAPGARVEPGTVGVRLRAADGRERVAQLPRSLLQRLVRGRAVDLSPERTLGAFTPAADVLGSAKALMIFESEDSTRAPWAGPKSPHPGEEDAARLAAALTSWWSADPSSSARAVCGTDPATSPSRWERAPKLDGTIAVKADPIAFPEPTSVLRDGLSGLPDTAGASLVVIVSAESPGVLGKRLRAMAQDPALAGKIVAVASLAGPLRPDLPASLLREGRFGGFGLYEAPAVGLARSVEELARFARAAAGDAVKGRRVEELPSPFTWFY